ncbi:ScbR family autoregulator-binding transcription factor [Streptomyces sp. B-S-A8]|uniref:ScbR family autoregulator-binding transcription factor n=1 Tax=Streptomyces solicavernae TaxID=3043614 RepID=A0ABT6S154_9ACTN|nr:ScbR family autoregulator-binding transcription factor [Streptomyces sp. B-S-A8]MDI3390400.1 ScbR family autoregulator-binding transcription factor [Streptomyces sp. B-S-A8]
MARQERGTRSRNLILKAAAEVFDERGYDSASTTQILERSGLTRGALYHHFPSKEAIAVALLTAHGEALDPPARSTKLQAVIDITFGFAHRLQHDPVLRACVRLAVEQTSFRNPAATPYQQSGDAIRTLLAEAQEQGEILPGIDLTEAADMITGTFTGIQVMSRVQTDRKDLPERVTMMWRFLLPGLVSPGMISHLRLTDPGQPDPSDTASGTATGTGTGTASDASTGTTTGTAQG